MIIVNDNNDAVVELVYGILLDDIVLFVKISCLPGTNIYMLTLGDFWSSNTIGLYLHRRLVSVCCIEH